MVRKIISIDLNPMEYYAKSKGLPYLPIEDIIEIFKEHDKVDVIECLVPLVRRVPEDDSAEALSRVTQAFISKQYALQMSGARVIEAPSKPAGNNGYKQSDDQRLMLTTLLLAMKLKPDYVTLFAADGDFAPMVEMLRTEGIRTEIVSPMDILAGELKKHAVRVIDFDDVIRKINNKVW